MNFVPPFRGADGILETTTASSGAALRPTKADLTVTCGARVTGEDSPSGHIVAERTLDLGHASAGAEERQLELFVLLGKGLTSLVDRSVQLAG